MKLKTSKKWVALVAGAVGLVAVGRAEAIAYVADGASGEYCGTPYKISVSVSKPSSGATVQYSETGADGTWVSDLGYTDACTDKPLYFKISASGYADVKGSANVTVTPKELTEDYVWGVFDNEEHTYVYDGTAHEPGVAWGDGEPTIITDNDFDVDYEDNVNAGTARIVFTGKNNYTGVVEEEYWILKADNSWVTPPSIANWTYGQTPSEPAYEAKVDNDKVVITYSSGTKPTQPGDYTATFTVPASQNYKELKSVVNFKIFGSATVTVTIVGKTQASAYDGSEKHVSGYDVVSISDPNYKTSDFKFTGSAVAKGSDVGTYPMGLKNSDFVNTNDTYATVNFAVTDGGLTVTRAANVWTVEPSIVGWTYGEAAKQPTGTAKFGRVVFSYSPMPVGAAGDYTMTASVVGTANYTGLEKSVGFTIARATISPEDDPGKVDPSVDPGDPGQVEDPTIRFSPWDYVGVYDGAAHTVDTNAMRVAYAAVVGEGLTVQYAAGGGTPVLPWTDAVPMFKDVVATSFWYKVSNANYEDIVHPCKVVITNRCVTMKSADGVWPYDGKEHGTNAVIVTVHGDDGAAGVRTLPGGMVPLVGDETVETVICKVRSEVGVAPNDFSIAWTGTAKEANYCVTLVTGRLEIVSASSVTVTVTAQAKTNVYTGVEQRNDGFVWSADNPVFTADDFTFAGCSNLASTAVCDLKMNLKPSDFAPKGSRFTSATFVIARDGTLVITKADVPGGGEEPGGGDVPVGGLSKFDSTGVYDGKGQTIRTKALRAAFAETLGESFTVYFAKDESGQPGGRPLPATDAMWSETPPVFTNVCEEVVWYKVTSENYADFMHQAKVTILPRDIAKATIAPIADVEYAGVPACPVPTVTDGDPSIITPGDYAVSYFNNDAPGTATLTLTGKGNYTGTKSANFIITPAMPKYASLAGVLDWKLNLGSGCYTAQLKLTCTNGFENGISGLRFLFADRTDGKRTTASLWSSATRTARPTTDWRETTYRFVSLDAAKIVRQDVPAVYGVKDVSQPRGVIPQGECEIELYVPSLGSPSDYEGLVVWTSGGADHAIKVSAAGGSTPVPEAETEVAMPLQMMMAAAPVLRPAMEEEQDLRNVFTSKDKDDKAIADEVLARWQGVYSLAYPEIDEQGVTNGWNAFSVRIGARGRTIVAGSLANGRSVSVSAQLLVGGEWCCIDVSPSRANAAFAFALWLSRSGEILLVDGVDGAVVDEVGNLSEDGVFGVSPEDLTNVFGDDAEKVLGDVLPENVPVASGGTRWIVPKVGTVRVLKGQLDYSLIRDNPSALRLSFAKTTGCFTGSFKVYLWDGRKLKTVSASVKGVVVGGVGYGTAKLGKYGTIPVSVAPVAAGQVE